LVELFDASRKDESLSDPWGLFVGDFIIGGETWPGSGRFDPQIPYQAIADDGTLRLDKGPSAPWPQSKAERWPLTLAAEAVDTFDKWLCREQGLAPLRATTFERALDLPSKRGPRRRLSALAG